MKFSAILESKVLGIEELESPESSDIEIANAALSDSNSTLTWMKFILTDSSPNGNFQRVPESEFESIITSGINMPVKMAMGRINENHDGAFPLGVITNLMREDNTVVALAAMWGGERQSDISILKTRINNGEDVMVSWELLYSVSSYEDEVEVLHGITLKAATVVGNPAYSGRTPVVAMSAKKARKWTKAYINKLPDVAFLITGIRDKDGKSVRLYPFMDSDSKIDLKQMKKSMDELSNSNLPMGVIRGAVSRARRIEEKLKGADASIEKLEDNTLKTVEELTIENEKLVAKNKALSDKLDKKDESLVKAEAALKELEALKEYKKEIEDVKARDESLAAIKVKFTEAGIEKEDDYFEDNSGLLLEMGETGLEFFVKEMMEFSAASDKKDPDKSNGNASKIPNIQSENGVKLDTKSLAEALRKAK